MISVVHNSTHKHRRWMVIWLVLSVIGLQFVSTMVMAEQFLSASDKPCHHAVTDEEQSCPCCEQPMVMDCDCVAQCGHSHAPIGITNIESRIVDLLIVAKQNLSTYKYLKFYCPPPFRPPIAS